MQLVHTFFRYTSNGGRNRDYQRQSIVTLLRDFSKFSLVLNYNMLIRRNKPCKLSLTVHVIRFYPTLVEGRVKSYIDYMVVSVSPTRRQNPILQSISNFLD